MSMIPNPGQRERFLDTYQPRDPQSSAANYYDGRQADVWNKVYSDCFREAMAGTPKVFAATMADGRTHDNEQEIQLTADIGNILATPGQSIERIGERVMIAVAEIAHNYAVLAADEAAERVRSTEDCE